MTQANAKGEQTGSNNLIDLTSSGKEFVLVEPYTIHTVTNPDDKVCVLLVIASEEFDPGNTDTYKLEVSTTR